MKEFLNEHKIEFKDLPDEAKLFIIHEKDRGNVEFFNSEGEWIKGDNDVVRFNYVYRTKPTPKLYIPWELFNPMWKYAVTDDKSVFLFTQEPYFTGYGWDSDKGLRFDLSMVINKEEFNLNPDVVSAKDSLTKRPEGV